MKCRSRYDGQRIWMYNCHIGESDFCRGKFNDCLADSLLGMLSASLATCLCAVYHFVRAWKDEILSPNYAGAVCRRLFKGRHQSPRYRVKSQRVRWLAGGGTVPYLVLRCTCYWSSKRNTGKTALCKIRKKSLRLGRTGVTDVPAVALLQGNEPFSLPRLSDLRQALVQCLSRSRQTTTPSSQTQTITNLGLAS